MTVFSICNITLRKTRKYMYVRKLVFYFCDLGILLWWLDKGISWKSKVEVINPKVWSKADWDKWNLTVTTLHVSGITMRNFVMACEELCNWCYMEFATVSIFVFIGNCFFVMFYNNVITFALFFASEVFLLVFSYNHMKSGSMKVCFFAAL